MQQYLFIRRQQEIPLKLLLFSASSGITGEWFRMCHLAQSLKKHAAIELIKPLPFSLPYRLDFILSLPYYTIRILLSDADVIIGNKPHFNVTLPMLIAGFLMKKKIVIDIDEADYLFVSGWPSALIAALQKPFPRYFDIVTYHNDLLHDFIIDEFKVPEKKLYQLRQGVDMKLFTNNNIPVNIGSLFFVGSLDVASSLGTILQAVKTVRMQRAISFTVAGGGLLAPAFKKQAAKLNLEINFTGSLSVADVIKEMAVADVCLAYYDNIEANRYRSSMKIREYLAMGKKVVCNDLEEMRQFAGFTYQSASNPDDFADKIILALTSSDNRELKGRDFAMANYDWETIGDSFFNKILSLGNQHK
jgi:glycosyltransferase involved in cell wall biosynthesis